MPMSSRPLRRQFFRKGSMSNEYVVPHSRITLCDSRSISISLSASASASSSSTDSRGSVTGTMPFFMQFEWKMSANDDEMMARIPIPEMDHGACSRDEPHPKLSPATRIFVPTPSRPERSRYSGRLRTKSATSLATLSPDCATSTGLVYRSSANAAKPRPVRLIVFRYSLGMIMSVSTFWMSSGAATPFRFVNFGMPPPPPPPAVASRMTAPADSTADSLCARWMGDSAGTASVASSIVRTSVSLPLTAAAAAMAGEQRCVRPPAPCRPSKLRFEVEAHRSLSPSLSGFIARHIEQPGCRQSKPASVRITSRPSSSACSLTRPEPGTTSASLMFAATLRPLATAATARMSSMRPLVHEPMKTLSTAIESIASFTCSVSPM
mmetsp:Transcript_48880/g.127649  ORF Transcript_48880/g.127649 Transcript_48880/m.127649 type:complete len:380 (+) Transcript_48880:253-1392(+)